MTPLTYYRQLLESKEFMSDLAQEQVIIKLQHVYEEFTLAEQRQKNTWRKLLKRWVNKKSAPVQGLYLWGGVGAGKTWLMDVFYHCLPTPYKLRIHFHRFMKHVHHELKRFQGQPDPLKKVASQLALQAKILCLDEFLVADITDAMLLANLLDALFTEGVTLITTSNVAPDNLYRNGLQRNRFLPAIALLKQYTQVMQIQSEMDYRLRTLQEVGIYFTPLNDIATSAMQDMFNYFARDQVSSDELLIIEGRPIATLCRTEEVVWFDFRDICSVPRSQLDYLEIARRFPTVLVSHVSQINPEQDDVICYLIKLVDVFYDANVKLILSAAVPVAELYQAGRYVVEFQRTQSRLLEMQTADYLRRPHMAKAS